MPELFNDDYVKAKARWETALDNYEQAINLYDIIYNLLKNNYEELNEAAAEFHVQQSKIVKVGKNLRSINIKSVKKGD